LACFRLWDIVFSSLFDNNFGDNNKEVTIQKYRSCIENSKNMFLVKYLHAFCFNIFVNNLNNRLVRQYLLVVSITR